MKSPRKKAKKGEGQASKLKMYFHSGTQDAIVKYQSEAEQQARNVLYRTEIMPAFEKLAENLINIHKFSAAHDNFDDLKNNCVNFLFETIKKFDHTRGTNAFSYFNVVAKNWLIIETKRKILHYKRNVSLDDPNSMTVYESSVIENHITSSTQEDELQKRYTIKHLVDLLYKIRVKVKNENELSVMNAIITIFENIDHLDITQKSGIMLYIRELTGLTPKQQTTALQQIKKLYKKFKIDAPFLI